MTTAFKATPNIHPRTHAAHTNTPTTATPRSAPSVAQVLADQKADQVIDRAGNIRESQAIAPSPAAPPRITAEPQLPVPSGPVSEEAFERNLANWGSGSGVPLVFNGLEGKFQTTGGEEVDVENVIFVAHLDETRKGWIKFNGEGEPPTTVSVGIMEDAQLLRAKSSATSIHRCGTLTNSAANQWIRGSKRFGCRSFRLPPTARSTS